MMTPIIVHDDWLTAKINFIHDVCKPCFPRQSTLHLFNNSVAATSGVSASRVMLPKRMSAYPSLALTPCLNAVSADSSNGAPAGMRKKSSAPSYRDRSNCW